MRADIEIPILQIAVGARIDRRVGERLVWPGSTSAWSGALAFGYDVDDRHGRLDRVLGQGGLGRGAP